MKVAVIGHVDHKTTILEALIRAVEAKTGEKVELVHVNHDEFELLGFKSEPILIKDFDMEIPKLIDHHFYPKAKHCTKGHERPYKYHR